MASPFSQWNLAHPISTDLVASFIGLTGEYVQNNLILGGAPGATQGVLGTLSPLTGPTGSVTTGWRQAQVNNDDTWITQNAYAANAQGQAPSFNRDDTGKGALAFTQEVSGPYFRWLYAPAAANPITWTELARLTSAGLLTLGTGLAVGSNPATSGEIRLTQGTINSAGNLILSSGASSVAIIGTQNNIFQTDSNNVYALIANTSGRFIVEGYGGAPGFLIVPYVLSAVNYLEIDAATTGNPVTLKVGGSDTNRSLNFVTAGTGTVQANGSPVLTTASSYVSQIIAGTGISVSPSGGTGAVTVSAAAAPTIVVKKGSGSGTNYSTSSTTYVAVDSTNLSYTVTVPVGQKLLITAYFSGYSSGGTHSEYVALVDGSTTLTESAAGNWNGVGPGAAMSLGTVVVGDGASHTITLQYHDAGGGSIVLNNGSATNTPVMIFELGAAN